MKTEITKQDNLKVELIGLKDMLEESLNMLFVDDETEGEINNIIEEFETKIRDEIFTLVDNLCSDEERG